MDKKLAIALALAVAAPSAAMAKGSHTMAGCGLGYVLFGHEDNSKVMQILAGTTNSTAGNQTFGITSGTSGCTEDGAVKFVQEAEIYAEVNLDTLRREMAVGQGEFVTTFAGLLGAREDRRAELVSFFKANYESLFPSATTSTSEFLENLGSQLAENPNLLS